MNIVQKASPNKDAGRDGWKPDIIVCHITDGSFNGAVSWLCNPDSKVSSHFVVAQDGRVTQLVPLKDTAWANGTAQMPNASNYNGKSSLQAVRERGVNANLYTISIEHEGVYEKTHGVLTMKQMAATTDLIQFIRSEVKRLYGVVIPLDREHIVGHNQITPVGKPHCPGEGFQFDTILKVLKSRETPTVTEADVVKFCDEEGIIGASTKGDKVVTYNTLRWTVFKLLHKD